MSKDNKMINQKTLKTLLQTLQEYHVTSFKSGDVELTLLPEATFPKEEESFNSKLQTQAQLDSQEESNFLKALYPEEVPEYDEEDIEFLHSNS